MPDSIRADGNGCALSEAFPFRTVFTFRYLLEYWEALDAASPLYPVFEKKIRLLIDGRHPLLDPAHVREAVIAHPGAVRDLMSIVFSPVQSENGIAAAQPIDSFDAFFMTESYRKHFGETMEHPSTGELEEIYCRILLYIYSRILKQFYSFEIFYETSMVVSLRDPRSGLMQYFNTTFDDRFVRLFKISEPPALGPDDITLLSENLNDLGLLMKMVPPAHFEIHGFAIVNKIDVTTQEIISEIKRALLDKNSILEQAKYTHLQDLIRGLLRKPAIKLDLAAIHHDRALVLSSGSDNCENPDCIYRDSSHYHLSFFEGSVFERASKQLKPVIINDFPEYCGEAPRGQADRALLDKGVKSVLIQSLFIGETLLGQCTLTSSNPYEFDPLNLMKMNDVYPLFALVIAHALEDFDNEVQSIIQSNFTSIHPAIEWRFRRAAMNFIDHHAHGPGTQVEPIVFDGVYPLYCTSDIRGSSTQRNTAIQSDLTEHLAMVRGILSRAAEHKALPILDEFTFRIDGFLEDLGDGLVTGDEIEIMHFLKKEVEPCFEDLRGYGGEVAASIDAYFAAMDDEMGTLYRKRKDFDESVDLINKTISGYLDGVQPEAQAMFPHYYDKNTTDGVDQNMYIGASLNEDGKFDRLYLKNLRLWQLMNLASIARLTREIQPRLKVHLETTHLVVVQDVPLTLVFKTDEKKLAVEGAYNIRYEIMKKRIDKAVVKETGERLTQIGKIAIVYSQASEAAEYRQYIEFLTARGYLEGAVEEFVLDDLQGIKGLRALRVGINLAAQDERGIVEVLRSA